jgi:F-type H+-transporting ATPase subunit b
MDIQLPQIIFQIINFSVVMGALSYFLYKPVLKVLAERSDRIEEAQKAAEQSIKEKERIAELEKQITNAAEKQAAEILDKARQSAKSSEKDLMITAKKKADDEIKRLVSSWQDEKKQHLADMKLEFVQAVITTSEKVAGSFDAKKQQQLIDDELKNLLKSI